MQPVSFCLNRRDIVIRTAAGSKLAAATRRSVVASEVDNFDSYARSGCSVAVVGYARVADDPAEIARLERLPWAPGRDHFIVIPRVGVPRPARRATDLTSRSQPQGPGRRMKPPSDTSAVAGAVEVRARPPAILPGGVNETSCGASQAGLPEGVGGRRFAAVGVVDADLDLAGWLAGPARTTITGHGVHCHRQRPRLRERSR
ncbi:pyridoxamine 5'-phosphate oxidase family protein [Nonomuraea sp. NPDC003214]